VNAEMRRPEGPRPPCCDEVLRRGRQQVEVTGLGRDPAPVPKEARAMGKSSASPAGKLVTFRLLLREMPERCQAAAIESFDTPTYHPEDSCLFLSIFLRRHRSLPIHDFSFLSSSPSSFLFFFFNAPDSRSADRSSFKDSR
jgi:hypothetical protein